MISFDFQQDHIIKLNTNDPNSFSSLSLDASPNSSSSASSFSSSLKQPDVATLNSEKIKELSQHESESISTSSNSKESENFLTG